MASNSSSISQRSGGKMSVLPIEKSQRTAAKVAGFLYLFLMATGMLDELLVRGPIIVANDASQTATNILASESLFRFGIVLELITCAGEVALAIALYTLLRSVNRSLALLGAFWRLAEGTIFGVVALSSSVALLFLSHASYLHAFTTDQVHALARIAIRSRAEGFDMGFAFLALGATVFSYLLVKSNYVPRALAVLGLVAYPLMFASSVVSILFPRLPHVIVQGSWLPALVFEVGCGCWFLFRGIDNPNRAVS